MALQYTATHRTNAMSDLVTALGGTAYLLIYSGSAPANVAAAATGTLLASLPLSATPGVASAGVLTFNAFTSATAATGTAGYWRLCTSAAGTTCIVQGSIGTAGADLNFAAGLAWTAGMTISVSSWTITAFGA